MFASCDFSPQLPKKKGFHVKVHKQSNLCIIYSICQHFSIDSSLYLGVEKNMM